MLNQRDVKLSSVFVLWGFDLLEEFRVPESRGVRRVDGSQPEAVAYRVNPSIHLRRTMRYRTRLPEPSLFQWSWKTITSNLTPPDLRWFNFSRGCSDTEVHWVWLQVQQSKLHSLKGDLNPSSFASVTPPNNDVIRSWSAPVHHYSKARS